MQAHVIESKSLSVNSHFLWFLTLTYTMVIVLANWFDPRLIKVFHLNTDAGTLIFPLTFLLSDLITEVYGFKHARRAIWCGFLFNALFIVYGQAVIHMPSPDYPTHNDMFDTLLAINIRIIFASAISYLCAESFNSFILAKLKIKMNGRYMGVRFVTSTFFASGVDSMIFTLIAFYGMMSQSHLLALALTMWLIKVAIEIAGLPLSIRLAKKLKQIEGLDIYDKRTHFNLFKLETNYIDNDNEFKNREKFI
jgi:uncharacterized integral membrane protein (TIGR00697 family)